MSVDLAGFEPMAWDALVNKGWLAVKRVTVAEAEALLGAEGGHLVPPGDPDDLFLEVVTGLASAARVGRNVLAPEDWREAAAKFGAEDSLIFVGADGRWSVKGTAWRRSGVFERPRVVQGERTFALRAADHAAVEGLGAERAPELRELALFTLRGGTAFAPTAPGGCGC